MANPPRVLIGCVCCYHRNESKSLLAHNERKAHDLQPLLPLKTLLGFPPLEALSKRGEGISGYVKNEPEPGVCLQKTLIYAFFYQSQIKIRVSGEPIGELE